MPSRRYRLAAPTDSNRSIEATTLVLYRPSLSRSSSIRSQLASPVSTKRRNKDGRNTVTTKSTPRWWLVLPPLALIMFITSAGPLLLNDLFEYRERQKHESRGWKIKQNTDCHQSQSTSIPTYHYWLHPSNLQHSSRWHSRQSSVQNEVSQWHIKNSLATLFPALFIFILLGSNCDIIGRRPLIFFPFVGKIIYNILFLITVSYNLSNVWLILVHALDSGFGSHGLVIVSALAYISDCTNASDRTRAFFIVEIILVVMRVAPMLTVSLYWRRHEHLYIVPLSIFLALSVIGLLYVMFIQPESIEKMRKHSLVRQFSLVRLKPIKRIYVTFKAKRSGNNRKNLLLITFTIIILLVVHFGYYSMYILYLYGRPFCMNALSVSLLASAHALVILLLTLFVVRFKEQMESTYLPSIIGALALIVDLALFGVSKTVWLLYIAVCIGGLYSVTQPVLRSKVTGLVQKNEYAVVFIAVGIIESTGHPAVGLVSNNIYKATLQFFPGLVFLVFAAVGFVPIGIMGYLYFIDRKKSHNNQSKTDENPRMDANT